MDWSAIARQPGQSCDSAAAVIAGFADASWLNWFHRDNGNRFLLAPTPELLVIFVLGAVVPRFFEYGGLCPDSDAATAVENNREPFHG